MNYIESSQPEIIRQNQIDEEYNHLLRSKLIDSLDIFMPWLINYRFLSKHNDIIKMIGSILYFGFTTMMSEQTLGEEYTHLGQYYQKSKDQINHKNMPLIPKMKRLLLVFFQSIMPFVSEKFIKKYYNRLKSTTNDSNHHKLLNILITCMPTYDTLVSNYFKIHLCIFFLEGLYLQFSKRFTSIRYIYAKKPQEHNIEYRKVGMVMLIQIIIELFRFGLKIYKIYFNRKLNNNSVGNGNSNGDNQSSELLQSKPMSNIKVCFICYEPRKYPSITPCGHVFCWDCILKYCLMKEECPLCKANCKPQKIIQLKNYY